MMNTQPGWQLLTTDENERLWQQVEALFQFPAAPGTELTYPAGSRLYDIGSIYEGEAVYREGTGDEDIVWRTRHYRDSEDDLNEKVLLALRENTAPSEFVYALNWQHNGYKLFPHHFTTYQDADNWRVPVVPNGDYYLFLAPDLEFGIFGHPWKNTLCLWGEAFTRCVTAKAPSLLTQPSR